MGLTPIEEQSDGGDETSGEGDPPGVRQRFRSAVSRAVRGVVVGICGLFVPAESRDSRPERRSVARSDGRETAIRPSGQARLESGPDSSQLPESPPDEPPLRTTDTRIESRIEGDRLRIHQPDNRDAYLSSDAYERVRR